MGSCQPRQGLTLIDLVIVILILGIVAMVAIPQLNGMISEAKLNEAAAELISGLHYARSLAVEHQRPFGLRADSSANRFAVFDGRYSDDGNAHLDDSPPVGSYGVVFCPLSKALYIRDLDTIYDGVNISAVPTGGQIRFYPDGHSSDASSLFVIQLGNQQRMISVNGTTGQIGVQ